MHRTVALVPLLLVASTALAGCSTSVGSCNDFVELPTAQARYDAAPIVIVAATVTRTDRTAEPDAVYRLHRARIERVVKGRLDGAAVDLFAPADQCFTSGRPAEYLSGDPLDGAGRSVLYLARDPRTKVLQLVTTEAIDPLPTGAPLPFSTASPTPSSSAP